MNFSSINLHAASNRIMGNLAGEYVSCLFRPLSGGALPPGNHNLSSPMSNSVYGTFALLSPVGPAAGSAAHSGAAGMGWINKGWVTKGSISPDWVNGAGSTSRESLSWWIDRWPGETALWLPAVLPI